MRLRSAFLAASLASIMAAPAFAAPHYRQLDAEIDRLIVAGKFPGLAMAVIDNGKIDLDKSIADYLPKPLPAYPKYADLSVDERWKTITLRRLLTHSSGLAAGFGVVVYDGPQGRAFFKGGHNDITDNHLGCSATAAWASVSTRPWPTPCSATWARHGRGNTAVSFR